jgi:hypothetical protein
MIHTVFVHYPFTKVVGLKWQRIGRISLRPMPYIMANHLNEAVERAGYEVF